MRQVGKITIKEDSEWGKALRRDAEVDAEQAATAAAEKARKEVLDRASKRAAEAKVYRDSIRYYDRLTFENQGLIDSILASRARRQELDTQSSEEWKRQEHYRQQLQEKCHHQMVIEHQTSWQDEYESYHDGHYERKCVECLLVEESTYHPNERNYGYSRASKVYVKLLNSQVVLLRKTIDGKEYELEFDDLKW
jgi:hypothetical protein